MKEAFKDAKAARSSTYRSALARVVDRQYGPVDEFDLATFDTLHFQVGRLCAALQGLAVEETEICVSACGERLLGGHSRVRTSATVRLVVLGPTTRSPIVWQTGGIEADVSAWETGLLDALPHELAAVQSGSGLTLPWTGTIVLDPWVASLLLHECIGHTSEADNFLEYVLPRGVSLGHRWTDVALTVLDDPTHPHRIGSYAFDDDGEPAMPTTVVRDGVWTDLLHCRSTASTFASARSGNGRRVAGSEMTLPRMSVLVAMPGTYDVQTMIGEIEDGWYCSGSWGGGSIGNQYVLRPTYARRIRDGRLEAGYLRRFELRGDKFAAIAAIDAIGDVTHHFDPAFGCDKAGQNDLPVSFSAPHLRLQGVSLMPLRARTASPK